MHGKRLWLRPVSAFFVAATMGLLAWGILGNGLTPGTRDSGVRREPTGAPPAVVAPSTIPSIAAAGVARSSMWLYLAKRLSLMLPMLLGITLMSFVVIHLAPGTPVELQTVMNPKASLEAQKRLRELYGLEKPLMVQYWDWLKRVALLDFGLSFSPDRRPVWDKIKERLGITISLNLMALALILLTAIPIGVLSAVRPHSWFDRTTTLLVFFGFAMPTFWLALLLIMFFGVYLDWLPISGLTSLTFPQFTFWQKVRDLVAHAALPVLVMAFGGLAGMSRYMRGNAFRPAGAQVPRLRAHVVAAGLLFSSRGCW